MSNEPTFPLRPGWPTPQEIDERAAEVRKTWNAEDFTKRRVQPVQHWTPQQISDRIVEE